MKLFILISIFIITTSIFAKDTEYQENTHNFLSGRYLIIGKYYESNTTYQGKATITSNGNGLKITKNINKQKINGNGKVERAIFADAEVLRMHFIMKNGQTQDETCLFRGDLDNYARISCYVYPPHSDTNDPGLEAWFIDKSKY